jgi:hypothetical protein
MQSIVARIGALALEALSMLLSFQPARGDAEEPVLEIVTDTALDPAKIYGRIVIKASNVTLEGRGAWLVGETRKPPKMFRGIGLSVDHVSDVRIKNVRARGGRPALWSAMRRV